MVSRSGGGGETRRGDQKHMQLVTVMEERRKKEGITGKNENNGRDENDKQMGRK